MPYKKTPCPKLGRCLLIGYTSQAWAASFEEMDKDTNNKETEGEDKKSYQKSYQKNQSNDVPSLAIHITKLTEGQQEVWLDEMKQLGINFQKALGRWPC